MAVFALANLTANPNSFTFTVPVEVPETIVNDNSLTLTNTNYPTINITSLDFDFIANSSVPNNLVTNNSFSNLNLSGFSDTKSISFDFKIPKGIPAIDEDDDNFKHETWEVGKLKVIGLQGDNSEISIKIEVQNNLKFYNNKVEVEIGDAVPKNISDGATEKPAVNDNMNIKVRYHNTYNKNEDGFTFKGNNVEAKLLVEGDEVATAQGEDDVQDGEIGVASLSLDLGDYNVGDALDVRIELKGTDNFGSLHGEVFEFKLEVQEEPDVPDEEQLLDTDGDGINDNIDLCPNTPPGCIVEFDGCRIDFDGDGIEDCTGSFSNNKKNNDKEKETKQNNIGNIKKSETKDKEANPQTTTTDIVKKSGSDSGATSFIFGLIIGAVGTALFFILTKV